MDKKQTKKLAEKIFKEYSQTFTDLAKYDNAPNPRKEKPVFTGFIKYFPDAILEVARTSQIANNQHNPGEPLHWAREKSTDHLDALMRHLIDYAKGNKLDDDGAHHLAKVIWRACAQLQLDLEENEKGVDGECKYCDVHDFCSEHQK